MLSLLTKKMFHFCQQVAVLSWLFFLLSTLVIEKLELAVHGLILLIRRNKRKTTFLCWLCVAVFVPLSLFSRRLLSFNPLLLCYIYSSFAAHLSVAPISFLFVLCSLLCCMNVILNIHSNIVHDQSCRTVWIMLSVICCFRMEGSERQLLPDEVATT